VKLEGAVGVLLAIASAGCIVRDVKEPTSTEPVTYPSRAIELANGLHVLLEEAPDFGAAGAVLVVGAGAANDPQGKGGLAHLAEHIVFSASHSDVSFYEWSHNLDGGVNAFTTWDATTYHAFERTAALPRVLAFLHGVVTEPLIGIDEHVFRREWRAVSNERRRGTEDGTPGQAEGWLISSTFPAASPYAHAPAGTPDSLAHITFDDVRAFVAAHYRPEDCTLVVTAPLSVAEQQSLLESVTGLNARLAGLEPHPPTPHADARPAPLPRSFETRSADVATPTLWIGWAVPPGYGAAGDLAPLVADIAETSAFQDLDEVDRDVATLHTGVIAGVVASLFFVRVTLKDAAHPAETARLVVEQLQGALGRITARGTTTEILAHYVGTAFIYGQESQRVRAVDTGLSIRMRGDPLFLQM
jgi:zinc protease